MKRNLAIILVGLLVIGYGQFMIPDIAEREVCADSITEMNTECQEYTTESYKNERKDDVRAGGFVVVVAGAFLLIGD